MRTMTHTKTRTMASGFATDLNLIEASKGAAKAVKKALTSTKAQRDGRVLTAIVTSTFAICASVGSFTAKRTILFLIGRTRHPRVTLMKIKINT